VWLWVYRIVLPNLLHFSCVVILLAGNLDAHQLATLLAVVQRGWMAIKPAQYHCPAEQGLLLCELLAIHGGDGIFLAFVLA